MQLGIGSYAYAWSIGVPGYPPARPIGALDLLQKAVDLDVSVLQIADNLPMDRLPENELDRLAEKALACGVCIEVGTRGIRPDHLRTYLGLAQRFGSPILRVVVDTADDQPAADEVVALAREVMPAFEQAEVCLAIENHDRFPVKVLADICDRIGSRQVGICLDTVNSFGSLEGPEVVMETLGPLVVNLHVKEFIVQRVSHSMGFAIEGRPAGQGHMNLPWMLKRLRDMGRDPNAILELWPPPEAAVEETIAKEQAWTVESIRYLRELIPVS